MHLFRRYSYDNYTGYSPPIHVDATGLRVPNANGVLVAIQFVNNGRNLQILLPSNGLSVRVAWSQVLLKMSKNESWRNERRAGDRKTLFGVEFLFPNKNRSLFVHNQDVGPAPGPGPRFPAPATNAVSVVRGSLLYALLLNETQSVVRQWVGKCMKKEQNKKEKTRKTEKAKQPLFFFFFLLLLPLLVFFFLIVHARHHSITRM